jgi:hypothetical protein
MRFLYINIPRVVLVAIISFSFLLLGKSYFTFAQPDDGMEFSFMNLEISIAEAPATPSGLIAEAQEVSALYEHYIVSTALQSMRVLERVKEVPPIIKATNDMAQFPSAEHSLYPHYLTKRFSQFKYTVDRDGIVDIDTTSPNTVCHLEQIKNCLKYME